MPAEFVGPAVRRPVFALLGSLGLVVCWAAAPPPPHIASVVDSEVSAAAAAARPNPVDPAAAPGFAQAPTNAILITVDTLRGDALGFAGGLARTPHLDNWAQQAWIFSRCYAAAMLTNPSHASLMTALYPRDHQVYDNDSGISDGTPTLAGRLQQQGFATAAVVNFRHLNPEVANLGQGFAVVRRAGVRERSAAEVTGEALAQIDQLPRPFFLWLHYTDPHAPYEPGPAADLRPDVWPARTPMREALRLAPSFQRNNPWFKRAFSRYANTADLAARYLAEVENVDGAFGALQDGLAARGLQSSTLVAVTADHGENLGEHGLYFHHGGLYDSAVHVPLVIRMPGRPPARLAAPVSAIDVAPTLLDLLGSAAALGQGQSLLPYVEAGAPPRAFVFSEHMLGQLVAVRAAMGTLIVHRRSSRQFPAYPFRVGRRELVAADSQGPTEPLDRALAAFLAAPAQGQAKPAPASNREALRALGYVE